MKKFLVKHVGNMGDLVFFVPPVLETLKNKYPGCHITFVTAWGLKEPITEKWGKRNQGGFEISLMMTNPHIDQLVHWHDTALSLAGDICTEEGQHFPTWNAQYYQNQKESGNYDQVLELDMGVSHDGNPMEEIYAAIGMPDETFTDYKIYLSDKDREVAAAVMKNLPKPRIVLLEGLDGPTTRGWDTGKVKQLEKKIEDEYGVAPLWFGAKYIPELEGRSLTLRENIATLEHCDIGIGVLSGPLHFAAAVGLPTITLYADQMLDRAAPAFFLNEYVNRKKRLHHTILGAYPAESTFLKGEDVPKNLTPAEKRKQNWTSWQGPGRQDTKAGLAVIAVNEIMQVLKHALPN